MLICLENHDCDCGHDTQLLFQNLTNPTTAPRSHWTPSLVGYTCCFGATSYAGHTCNFSQCQVSSAVLWWPGDGDHYYTSSWIRSSSHMGLAFSWLLVMGLGLLLVSYVWLSRSSNILNTAGMNTTSTPSVEYQVPGYAWNNKYVTVGRCKLVCVFEWVVDVHDTNCQWLPCVSCVLYYNYMACNLVNTVGLIEYSCAQASLQIDVITDMPFWDGLNLRRKTAFILCY